MPKAARERSVSFRARAPHSLRFREYPRPKASLDEQDLSLVTERGTDVKRRVPFFVTVVGLDIDHASRKLDLSKVETIALPPASAAE